MKSTKSLLLILATAMLTFLSAFVSPSGGEGFEIYVDNKLVVQKFNQEMKTIKNFELNNSNIKSELKVKFYHCGMPGNNRSLSLKDTRHKILKQWQFNNEPGKNFAITIPVKEVLALQQKAGNTTIYLYYSSKEASSGRLLAGLTIPNKKMLSTK